MPTGGGSTTPIRERDPCAARATGGERPAPIDVVTSPYGPEMPFAIISKTLYAMQCKLESMETWAGTINDALADHADHIDLHVATVDGQRVYLSEKQEELDKTK